MKILVTAGPTREYIDTVRFISNASSGQMGCAVAAAASAAGHEVTLLLGKCSCRAPDGVEVVPFVTVDDLGGELDKLFDDCDVLVMSAAVGDFRVDNTLPAKLHRSGGPVQITLFPTDDILAGLGRKKQANQKIISFSVEDGSLEQIEEKALAELATKNADFVVVNTPAAMDSEKSEACILSEEKEVLSWANRNKKELAEAIVGLF